jgi:two-component system, NarL family, invasion response regulator UvrY
VRNVLLVDDHPIVRQGIARVLSTEIDDLSLDEAVDARSAIERLRKRRFDLVLLDLTLPGGESGLALLRRLHREFANTPIMVVSMHPVDQFAQRAMTAGAIGYVAKDSDPQELVEAVRTALEGGVHMPQELREAARQRADPPPHEVLSDREYQILRMIGVGRTVTQISSELGLSVKTTSTYRARILQKLRLRTSAELIHYAVVNKLVT